MRTAIITGLTHAGKGVLLSGKETPLLKQIDIFKTFRKGAILDGSHPEYREVSYQENDGSEELLTFLTPAAKKEYLESREKEKQAHAAQLAAHSEREGISRADKAAADKAAADKAAADKAAADKAAADKAAADKPPGNEFKAEELNAQDQGALLKLADELTKAGRITAPAKTSKSALVEAILAAKPKLPNSEIPTPNS
jgi:hypothetical protein